MVKVRIYKCPDKAERAKIRRCVLFFIERLMPRKKRLDIKIVFDPTLLKDDEMSGSCVANDDAINKRHFEFTIHVENSLKISDKLSILAHEITHVKQFATGQLLYDASDSEISIWEGVKYHNNDIKYDDQPWEIDAVNFEKQLVKELIQTDLWR